MQPTISLQMYTLRDLTQTDMLGTLEKVAALGYQGIELAGYGNADCDAIAAKTRELGLRVTGCHTSLDTVQTDEGIDAIVADNQKLGNTQLIVGWVGEERRGSREKWLETAEQLEAAGRKLKERGFTLCYHNHDFEFNENTTVNPFSICCMRPPMPTPCNRKLIVTGCKKAANRPPRI